MAVKFELTPEDYEDGVAELLALKFDGSGIVERNVMLPSRSGGRDRQIDILVRIPLADIGEVLMIVDCKRYGTKVDVKDVEAFIGMVEDVGAPIGLLVTTEGYTKGAVGRAAAGRDIRIDVIRVEDLPGWEPPLVVCELCREAIGDDAPLGMAYIDIEAAVETEHEDEVVVTLGYCEKCKGLHIECQAVRNDQRHQRLADRGMGRVRGRLRPCRVLPSAGGDQGRPVQSDARPPDDPAHRLGRRATALRRSRAGREARRVRAVHRGPCSETTGSTVCANRRSR